MAQTTCPPANAQADCTGAHTAAEQMQSRVAMLRSIAASASALQHQHQLQWSHQQTRAHLQNRFVMPSSSASGGWAAAAPGTRLAQLMHRRALSGRKGCW